MSPDDELKFPLFEVVYSIVLAIERARLQFPKRLKFSIGERLSLQGMAAIELTVSAVVDKEARLDVLKKLITCLETLRILIRLCHDLQAISGKQYGRFSEMIVDALSQGVGFLKSTKKSTTASNQV